MPSHRHATPSSPWPFIDVNDQIDTELLDSGAQPRRQTHESELEYPFNSDADDWHKYPQSLFPNWSIQQQRKGGVYALLRSPRGGPYRMIHRRKVATSTASHLECSVFRLVMQKDGCFRRDASNEATMKATPSNEEQLWALLVEPVDRNARCQLFFVDSLSGSALQMFGTRFTIDPFFFSSSISWIPSRYSEQVIPGRSDHITLTLTYIVMRPWSSHEEIKGEMSPFIQDHMTIDTHVPLVLQSCKRVLMHDLVGIHAVRHQEGHYSPSTIVTYVPPSLDPAHRRTSASDLSARILATGHSVHWADLYRTTQDATMLVLAELWYPLYAWDEALEMLTVEVIWLEGHTLSTLSAIQTSTPDSENSDIDTPPENIKNEQPFPTDDTHSQTYIHTHQLHVLRAHLLHYAELISDFKKTVQFLADTPHPGIASHPVFSRECKTLLNDISRLEGTRAMLDARVGNVMDLAFASVTNEDSKRMQALSEASLRDSAAMKQIAYITMIYLPAAFSAAVFGMNTTEINPEASRRSISTYFAIAVPLTLLTIWTMTLLYRSEKKRREIESQRRIFDFSFESFRLLVWSLAARLVYPIMMLSEALSFTPKAQNEMEEVRVPSGYPSARSSMRSVHRGGRSAGHSARSSMHRHTFAGPENKSVLDGSTTFLPPVSLPPSPTG